MGKRVCKEDQLRLITECRQSGLSDYQWCEQNGIHPGNFYNWVSKLKNRAILSQDQRLSQMLFPMYRRLRKSI